MPRTYEQLETIRDESRERILTAALGLFARYGYAATSVRMIAGEAGVSQGLLYNYFDGKAGLLRAIFERSMRDVQQSFEQAATAATPADQIEGLIRGAFALVGERLDFWRLTYQLRFQPEVLEGLAEALQSWSDPIRAHLEHLLRGCGAARPEVEARAVFAAIDGASQHFALDPENYPLDAVAEVLTQRFTMQSSEA